MLRKLPQDFFGEMSFPGDVDLKDQSVRAYYSTKFPYSDRTGLKRFENELDFPPGCLDALNPSEIIPNSCQDYDCECFKGFVSTQIQEHAEREVERIENVFEKEKDEYVKLENELMIKEEELLTKDTHGE